MFDVLFYLLYVFMHDRSQRAVRGSQVQSFADKESSLSLEKGK
jgi:hypothetical protein